jgi:hypothetical protein
LGVRRLFYSEALIEHEHPPSSNYGVAGEHEQEQEERGRISPKKNYRPPRPIGVKGGCSPQNILKNFVATKRASARSQQILCEKIFNTQNAAKAIDEINDE